MGADLFFEVAQRVGDYQGQRRRPALRPDAYVIRIGSAWTPATAVTSDRGTRG
ncbi:hypothetical protein AB4305_29730 [Nocardia sp. 2YAB30]|uniref:hypothetical protein n=1 Tax=Nocardia sp. 2YAB30 TaxID=3233022 RepID=UPI003F969689